jgi:hyaluronan synthase
MFQLIFSFLNHKINLQHQDLKYNERILSDGMENPYGIVLLVVGHQERKDYWKRCLLSIKNINPMFLKGIYIIIDGNTDKDDYMSEMVEEILIENSKTIQISQRGKRGAMFYGFQLIKKDFMNQINNIDVVVTDSDTELHPDSLLALQKCLRSHPKNGCATGLLDIYNLNDGLLPKIVNARYAYAFVIERAATSYFGCMTCCSGPISIYKLSVIDEMIMQKFITQKFLNVKCEPGDDRHLTNLVMAKGYFSRQTNLSIASTESPETWTRFLNQQLRWSRSYYRELYWVLKAIPFQSYYLCLVVSYETLFPIFILVFYIKILYFNTNLELLYKGLIISAIILCIRTFALILYLKNWMFLYNFLYYPIYLCLLLPTKLYAIASTLNNNWVTVARNSNPLQSKLSIHFVFLMIWNFMFFFGFFFFNIE